MAFTLVLPLLVAGPVLAAPDAPAPARICIATTQIQDTKVLSDREIVFRLYGGKSYKNTLPVACPDLKLEGGFRWHSRGDEICSNSEVIYVVRRGNACPLGEFTDYTPPAAQ